MMKSQRSLKSGNSTKSVDFGDQNDFKFEKMLLDACEKFIYPYSVVVTKDFQIDAAPEETNDTDRNAIVVKTSYNNVNQLSGVTLINSKHVPRIVIQLIGALAPFYAQLTKISIKRSCIDKYTVYELSKFLPRSNITEICLDGSELPEANYALLLDSPILRNLSLSSCKINDLVCEQIFKNLDYLKGSETSLVALNLSSNQITDIGAKYIAGALRTNRHLRYLNLADNRITDDGAAYIFAVLLDFTLTDDEISQLRKRRLEYFKIQRALITKYFNENETPGRVSTGKNLNHGKPVKHNAPHKKEKVALHHHNDKLLHEKLKHYDRHHDDLTPTKTQQIMNEHTVSFDDPFSADNILYQDGKVICKGNFTLSYLNVSYNELMYPSLKIIEKAVQYQQSIKIKTEHGLLKILVDGNNLPINCTEIANINAILNDNMAAFDSRSLLDKTGKTAKKRSSVSNKSLRVSSERISVLHLGD